MQQAAATPQPNAPETAALSAPQLLALLHTRDASIAALRQQLEWFKRQMFGAKSERFAPQPDPAQLSLGQAFPAPGQHLEVRKSVPAHTRRVAKRTPADESAEALPFFDESRVPVQVIHVANPEVAALAPEQYELIGEKVSFRLAQRPGSFVVLKYVRQVVKRLDTQTLHTPPAPTAVLDGSRADVSFLAALLVDKFAYHLPLYRQHQRLTDCGFTVSRPWLTQLCQQIIALLDPVYQAQLDSIRQSRVKAMDETPIKAGRTSHGKMKTGYFWPLYGERDEVCFPYFASRASEHVQSALGLTCVPGSVLLTDGYAAYERYAKKTGLTHAQCWVHYPEPAVIRSALRSKLDAGVLRGSVAPDNPGLPIKRTRGRRARRALVSTAECARARVRHGSRIAPKRRASS